MTDSEHDITIDSPSAATGQIGQDRVRVFLTQSALETMNQHAASEPHHEIGGVMVGSVAHDAQTFVIVEAAIRGQHMTHTRGSVTFTHDSWAAIYREIDASYPDKRIVGWYHSHPGFGIFLSEHDLFIHRNFFSAPWQVAFVTDPKARTCGLFTWQDGQIDLYAESQVFTWSLADLEGPVHAPADPSAATDTAPPSPAPVSSPAAPHRYLLWGMGLLAAILILVGALTISTREAAKRTEVAVDALRAEVRSIAAYVQDAERVSSGGSVAMPGVTEGASPAASPPVPPPLATGSGTAPGSEPVGANEEQTPDGASPPQNQTE